MTEISGDGGRLKIKCEDPSGDCSDTYSYVDLVGATASGSGACTGGIFCSYQMTEISGDGGRLKIKCEDPSGDCSDTYSYVDLAGVESCQ